MKVKIGEKTHDIEPDDLQLDDGYALITPDSVPDGYYTQEALQNKIQERTKNTAKNARQEALEDEDFHKRVLSKYNIVLGDDGKPKGLEPTVDIEEVKQSVAEQVSSDYENKLEEYKNKLSKRDQAVVKSAIMEAASGNYADYLTKSFDDEDPLVVQKFMGKIGVDEDGNPFVKDENGEKRYKGDGPMSVKDYLLNEDKFGELMKDKRQRGSKFGNAGAGTNGTPSGNPMKWSTKQKLKYMEENPDGAYRDLVKKYKESEKDD